MTAIHESNCNSKVQGLKPSELRYGKIYVRFCEVRSKMNWHQSVRINAPAVVGEVIENEAIVVNLKTGIYYSFNRTASEIWGFIQQNTSSQEIAQWMSERYPNSSHSMNAEISTFLGLLQEEKLIVFSDLTAEPLQNHMAPANEQFVSPAFDRYSEMANLLLLDPIHDVDEEGWPHAKADSR